MKRTIASVGLVALGAATVQAAYTPGLTPAEQSKPWSVTLAVRGFYDDNYTTQTSNLKRDSFGVSVNPTLAVNLVLEQTLISFSYNYDLRWYEDRTSNEADHIQVATFKLEHAFSERLTANVSERFIYAQEGSVYVDGPVSTVSVLQDDSDYIRNIAKAGVHAGLTERLMLDFAYKNEVLDYEQEDFNSRSALLDRLEHLFTLEGGLAIGPRSTGMLGYQYGIVDHTNDDGFLYVPATPGNPAVAVPGSYRDMASHYIYAGISHEFNPKLNGSIRAGVQLADYTNADDLNDVLALAAAIAADPSLYQEVDDSGVIPYIDARLAYTYNPGSVLSVGVVNTYNQTDVGSAMNQESVAVFADIKHRISPKWTVGGMALFQVSSFNDGLSDGDSENTYLAGANATYSINPNLLAEISYNFDKVESDLDYRSFSRNRVFIGLRAAF